MTNSFQLQMRTIYFTIEHSRNTIKINQKSEVLDITAKDYSQIFEWIPDMIVPKILIHTLIGLPNIGKYCQVRCNRTLPHLL